MEVTSKFKAWINVMPGQPTPGGTLHVKGEVDTQSADFAFLERRNPQGINERILFYLQVKTGTVPANNPQEINYSENLDIRNPYDLIEIL